MGILLAPYSLMKPADVYDSIINIIAVLIVGGAVYFIVSLIRKKYLK